MHNFTQFYIDGAWVHPRLDHAGLNDESRLERERGRDTEAAGLLRTGGSLVRVAIPVIVEAGMPIASGADVLAAAILWGTTGPRACGAGHE